MPNLAEQENIACETDFISGDVKNEEPDTPWVEKSVSKAGKDRGCQINVVLTRQDAACV